MTPKGAGLFCFLM